MKEKKMEKNEKKSIKNTKKKYKKSKISEIFLNLLITEAFQDSSVCNTARASLETSRSVSLSSSASFEAALMICDVLEEIATAVVVVVAAGNLWLVLLMLLLLLLL